MHVDPSPPAEERDAMAIGRAALLGMRDGEGGWVLCGTCARCGSGILDAEDLRRYHPVWREPVKGRFRDLEIVSMPPPSSGGIHLVQMLNMIEKDDLAALDEGARAHLFAEVMRRAFADRAVHIGDPGFHKVPVRGLTDKGYAAALRRGIDPDRATPSRRVRSSTPARYESPDTTHLSIIDAAGNAVSLTQSINYGFGAGVVVPGTGILLNDTMDDFSVSPGTPNVFGLLGGEANAIAADKIPLSSMSPTIVLRQGRPWIALGASGGSTIITSVFQVLVRRTALGEDLYRAVAAPRIHQQWLPDVVILEPGAGAEVERGLVRRGHAVKRRELPWNLQAVEVAPDTRLGAADPRRDGAVSGY
jgi:gamma-glutamyltranspeptidase/glutathione hydrolase